MVCKGSAARYGANGLLTPRWPICSLAQYAPSRFLNAHIDSDCSQHASLSPASSQTSFSQDPNSSQQSTSGSRSITSPSTGKPTYSIFQTRKESKVNELPGASSQPASVRGSKKHGQETAPLSQPQQKRNKISTNLAEANPLAERLRPRSLDNFISHRHLTGPESLLMKSLAAGSTGSMILWGPPGCGKTTLARLIAKQTNAIFKELSATIAGINDDIFLPFLEQGQIQLIGATTENPSFRLTGALVSRCRVFVLERLTDDDIEAIVRGAVSRLSSAHSSSANSVCLDLTKLFRIKAFTE
ncbi:hypothetical protein E1B28_006412 [Marasmius oreades]|uniref:ATPase AAA-type core domain-containing protein n=1 Tax=Marasmius oreades TaxID=181124 RepID=A0A9P7S886_9AGAR|nr:uncharacterized protein E1B28_006412 [Marasmius oreades]KAG7095698.1 hypothetical protein E1B28_006412 [Marasmius oreades]